MRYTEILKEYQLDMVSNIFDVIEDYPDKFIHFTNQNKIGINPNPNHGEVPGVYFYPINWLLNNEEEFKELNSDYFYGIKSSYFYIADIDMTNVINLGELTREEALKYAENSKTFSNNLESMLNDSQRTGLMFYKALESAFYGKDFVNSIKGIDGLYDPGYGLIHHLELSQVVIFNPKVINVIRKGNNKVSDNNIIKQIGEQLAERLNGKLYFHKKLPTVEFVYENIPMKVIFTNPTQFFVVFHKNGKKMTKEIDFGSRKTIHGDVNNIINFINKLITYDEKDIPSSNNDLDTEIQNFIQIVEKISNNNTNVTKPEIIRNGEYYPPYIFKLQPGEIVTIRRTTSDTIEIEYQFFSIDLYLSKYYEYEDINKLSEQFLSDVKDRIKKTGQEKAKKMSKLRLD